MKKSLLILAALLAPCAAASAQTAPTVSWTQPNVATVAQAQSFTYRLYVTPSGSSTSNAAVVLASVACTGTAPSVQCSAPLPAAAAPASVTGAKATITSQDAASGTAESSPSVPFISGAAVPTALRVGN